MLAWKRENGNLGGEVLFGVQYDAEEIPERPRKSGNKLMMQESHTIHFPPEHEIKSFLGVGGINAYTKDFCSQLGHLENKSF